MARIEKENRLGLAITVKNLALPAKLKSQERLLSLMVEYEIHAEALCLLLSVEQMPGISYEELIYRHYESGTARIDRKPFSRRIGILCNKYFKQGAPVIKDVKARKPSPHGLYLNDLGREIASRVLGRKVLDFPSLPALKPTHYSVLQLANKYPNSDARELFEYAKKHKMPIDTLKKITVLLNKIVKDDEGCEVEWIAESQKGTYKVTALGKKHIATYKKLNTMLKKHKRSVPIL